jgi:hypothetical protein
MPSLPAMFAFSSLLATAFLVLPLVVAIRSMVQRQGLGGIDSRLVMLLAFTAIVLLRPLNYVATLVTADAPAICLMALCLLILRSTLQSPRWVVAAGCSLMMTLSVACKQNMLIAGLIVTASVFFFFGRRFALQFFGFTFLWIVGSMAIATGIYGNLQVIYLNNVVVPSHIPVVPGRMAHGATLLYEYASSLLLFMVGTGMMWFLTTYRGREHFKPQSRRFVIVFFVISVAFVPSSLRTFAVVGGDVNSFSHLLYFLIMGITLALAELMVSFGSQARFASALRIWILTFGFFGMGLSQVRHFDALHRAILLEPLPAMQAYEYDKQNPGLVYFPSNSIGTYLAEHRFYGSDWGVLNLSLAGQPLQRRDLLRYIPAEAKYVALPNSYGLMDYLLPFYAPHRISVQIPGLKNFSVFALERDELRTQVQDVGR